MGFSLSALFALFSFCGGSLVPYGGLLCASCSENSFRSFEDGMTEHFIIRETSATAVPFRARLRVFLCDIDYSSFDTNNDVAHVWEKNNCIRTQLL